MLKTRKQAHICYKELFREAEAKGPAEVKTAMADLARKDLFYLLFSVLGRKDINDDWLYDRCREVQKNPDGNLDLWAREHYKSTIITFGLTVQDILNNPEITVGIFSHTRPIAKGFLRQIKVELESNEVLKGLFPEILYASPRSESPRWSEDNGIVVKRKTNPNAATVEAWGLVDGQPTSKHFLRLIYDDVVTRESVTTPEMIKKTTGAWELSLNLAAQGGSKRYIGTRYHFADTYDTMMQRGSANPRIYPATGNGKVDGEPVLLSREELIEKRRDMGLYTFGCQMLQNPKADTSMGFHAAWLKYWRPSTTNLNLYILCDPAGEKKKGSDYTVFMVVGYAGDGNYYVVDIIRDKLNLAERTRSLFELHRHYRPAAVGYEKYGMQSDIEHIKEIQGQQNYGFDIIPLGGPMPKNDRIRRLVPIFEAGRMYIPEFMVKPDYEGRSINITQAFVNDEYLAFPVSAHDDMLDCLARICDEDFPMVAPASAGRWYQPKRRRRKAA